MFLSRRLTFLNGLDQLSVGIGMNLYFTPFLLFTDCYSPFLDKKKITQSSRAEEKRMQNYKFALNASPPIQGWQSSGLSPFFFIFL